MKIINITQEEIKAAFSEWNRRFSENPESFSESILAKDGKLIEGVDARQAAYFVEIIEEQKQTA